VLLLGVLLAASPAVAQNINWPVESAPRPLAAREVKFPPYEVRTLGNGMQVITVLHHEQPAVTMRLLVRAGAAQDPEKKGGVAYLAAQLLDQGTPTRTASQIADQIDFIGGALGTGSGADLTFANVVVMKDSFEVGMNLLADVVRNPAFAPEEIERQKEQALSSLKVSSEDPDYLASAVFDRLVYGFHPYGLPGSGTPESLASITRGDLVDFHRRYFIPNNIVLAVVGDVTSQEAFATAEKVFGSWPRGEVPAPATMQPPQPTRRVVIIDKPDSVQTEIRVGQLAIPRKHPDYLAWDLAVKILGGEGANRLHRVLRSERGLTYGASADTESMKQAGDFVAETNTRTDTTGEALRLVVEEFSRLQRQRVFERELADAQAYLSGSFPLTIETPNEIATQILNAVFYELPLDEISTFRERVLSVTPDDIQRVARQYIKPDRLSIVLVGNAQAFLPQLRSVGFTDFDVIPIAQLDIMSGTLRREQRRAVARSFGSAPSFERVAYTAGQVNPRAGQAGLSAQSQPNAPPSPRTPASPRTPNEPTAPGDQTGAGGSSRPPAANVQSTANAASERAAMDLLRRVVEAKGGLAALKAVRTVVADASTTMLMQGGQLPATTTTYVVYPEKFRVDATLPGENVLVQVYNAGAAWLKDPGGVHEAPPPMRDDFAASVRRDTIPVLIGALEGTYAVRVLPEETRTDAKPLKILEISGRGLAALRLFIDDEGLIARQAFSTPGPDGRRTLTEEVFADYRTVNGVRVPFAATVLKDGRAMVKRVLTKVTINGPVADRLFEKPS
jgi:zinc protease